MRPTLAPPYTSRIPRVATSRPSAVAASVYDGRAPGLEPLNTQTDRSPLTGAASRPGVPPCFSSSVFTRLNGRDPKNPRDADSGLGCTDSTHGTGAEHRLEALRVAAPEDRGERAAPAGEHLDGPLGDRLPAAAAVRGRRARSRR